MPDWLRFDNLNFCRIYRTPSYVQYIVHNCCTMYILHNICILYLVLLLVTSCIELRSFEVYCWSYFLILISQLPREAAEEQTQSSRLHKKRYFLEQQHTQQREHIERENTHTQTHTAERESTETHTAEKRPAGGLCSAAEIFDEQQAVYTTVYINHDRSIDS